jgi:hypothetical protein
MRIKRTQLNQLFFSIVRKIKDPSRSKNRRKHIEVNLINIWGHYSIIFRLYSLKFQFYQY